MKKITFMLLVASLISTQCACGFFNNFWSKADSTKESKEEEATGREALQKRKNAKSGLYSSKTSGLNKQSLNLSKTPLKKSNSKSAPTVDTKAAAITPAERKVEILWQVPSNLPTKYHLNWGKEESNLSNKAEVSVDKLPRSKHPVYGDVFRYVVSVPSADRAVFFSIQAENSAGLSDKTPVKRVDIEAALKTTKPRRNR